MRGEPREIKRDPLVLADHKVTDRLKAFAAKCHRGLQEQTVRSPNGGDAARDAPDPRDHATVVEADDEFHPHWHIAAPSNHDPDHVGQPRANRHEVEHGDHAGLRRELGLQDGRVPAIAPHDGRNPARGREEPSAMVGRA